VKGPPAKVDIAVVGAGIIGLAVARELRDRRPGLSVAVLEREERIAAHQTSHNSGVIHAGIYYPPGSLKAKLCVEGGAELYRFCEERGVPVERCGKLIVSRDERELPRLAELERRGRQNGVRGLRRLGAGELRDIEPHCRGVAALHSPATGIVDFAAVAHALAEELREHDVRVFTGCGVQDLRAGVLRHTYGDTATRFTVVCAGAWADRLAIRAGAGSNSRIMPFRGAYLLLKPERRELVRSLIYPVPDPSLPFLGVHLTRHIDGEVSLGPTALLAAGPDAYRLTRVRPRDLAATLAWSGSWRLFRRWWRTGLTEIGHALSRRWLARSASEYVPELRPGDFGPGFAGIRGQAVGRDGKLVDDFVFSETERALHVRNAPSPAATSSLAIARLIADRAERGLD
jgi:(S)-2-hydroxyglutarate dehydrogenase